MEHKLDNNKRIDFKLYSVKHQKEILVEIMNVHLDRLNLNNQTDFQEQLINKIGEKIFDKTKGVITDHNFHLQLILWGDGGMAGTVFREDTFLSLATCSVISSCNA